MYFLGIFAKISQFSWEKYLLVPGILISVCVHLCVHILKNIKCTDTKTPSPS